MNSKERFEAACEFRQPDRLPVDYLVHTELDKRLKQHLGCQTEEELLDKLGCDFFYLPGRDISQNEGFLKYYTGALPFTAPEDVAAHAREVTNVLNQKGGCIFAPSQILGPDIPVENVVAMYGC